MKRALDILVSATGLLLLAPLVAIIALSVALGLGRPVLFRQQRPGLHGKSFDLIKFRSMREAFDDQGNALSDGERLTGFGRLLRHTSLDELPELWNILRGEMSLVGPRPLLMEYLDLYSPEQMRRHEVRPGLTGWAQIHGRNRLSWDERFRLDVWYVDHQSFWLDLKIMVLTLIVVFRARGITPENETSQPKFKGTAK